MKRSFILSLAIITCILCTISASAATKPIAKTYKVSEVLLMLQKKGYNNFQEVERHRGPFRNYDIFEVECYDAHGQKVKVYFDPTITGKTTPKTTPKYTLLKAVQKVESLGYQDIYAVDMSRGRYKIKAISKTGKKAKIYLDPTTGQIIPMHTEGYVPIH